MEIRTAHIEIPKTARYFIYGDTQMPHNEIVFVLHGYGMNAKSFLESFAILKKEGRLIVAPEGLSRFYRKGFTGEVVSSWMTKEDRLDEIDDYIGYLNQLYDLLTINPKARITVLGFSQGATTASRWVMNGNRAFDDIVIWCGEFAKDTSSVPVRLPVCWHVAANDDAFIDPDKFDAQVEYLKIRGFKVNDLRFVGGHVVDQVTLKQVWSELSL